MRASTALAPVFLARASLALTPTPKENSPCF